MPKGPAKLPSKQEVALSLLQSATSVYVHLDPRPEDVLVPSWFKKQPQLVLQIGLNMAVQIPDLDVGDSAISCTLSFNRSPEFCKMPYSAIFALVGEDGRGMVWPESVPAEVAAAAEGRSPAAPVEQARRPKLRVAKEGKRRSEAATEEQQGGKPRARAGEKAKGAEQEPKSAAGSTPEVKETPKKKALPPYLRVVK